MEFKAFPKIKRMSVLEVLLTEKMDGTNGCLGIQEGKLVGVQSRNRQLTPEDDNYGFATWAYSNAEELVLLGDGYHYGEWCGPGIQENRYGLASKTFYLFKDREHTCPLGTVTKVPFLYYGEYRENLVEDFMVHLKLVRNYQPEGIMMYIPSCDKMFKTTYEHSEGKWKGN